MKLIDEVRNYLLNNDGEDVDWYGDYSDGGYYMKMTKSGEDSFECEFNGATCYGVPRVNEYTVTFGADTYSDNHIIVWFKSSRGHGSTHITDIDSFKWYLDKILD
jgi:hypothetical protein